MKLKKNYSKIKNEKSLPFTDNELINSSAKRQKNNFRENAQNLTKF